MSYLLEHTKFGFCWLDLLALIVLIVVVVFFVMMKFELGNLYTAFIGVFGLKVAAYMQPLTHKLILKLLGGKATPTPSDSDKMKSEKEVKL